jgi:hypothetical protein
MDSYPYHMTKWDPQPIVGGSWARVHPDPLNYNKGEEDKEYGGERGGGGKGDYGDTNNKKGKQLGCKF